MKRKIKKRKLTETQKKIISKMAYKTRTIKGEEYFFSLISDFIDNRPLDENEIPNMVIATAHFKKKINDIISKINGKNIYLNVAKDHFKIIGFKTNNFKKGLSEITGKDVDTVSQNFLKKFDKNENAIIFELGLIAESLTVILDRSKEISGTILHGSIIFGDIAIDTIN